MTGFLNHPTVGISTSSAWRYIDASSQPHLAELKKEKIAGFSSSWKDLLLKSTKYLRNDDSYIYILYCIYIY